MKTFLPLISPDGNPWSSMRLSLSCLDNKRLGKQRVESFQIYRVIQGLNAAKGWRLAPAVHMWRGYPEALGVYIAINCELWAQRSSSITGQPFQNAKMGEHLLTYKFGQNAAGQLIHQLQHNLHTTSTPVVWSQPGPNQRAGRYFDGIRIPWWFHDRRVHDSDACRLYHKDPKFYKQFKKYGPMYEDYVWPRDINPYHPEQKEELDALQAELDAEAKVKELKASPKKKQGVKRPSPIKQAEEEVEAETEEESKATPMEIDMEEVAHAAIQTKRKTVKRLKL